MTDEPLDAPPPEIEVDTDAVAVAAAAALEAGHRPILGTALFDLPRRFLLNRHVDEAGTTGVGAVAWGVMWPDETVALHWQTADPMRGGIYSSMESVLRHHGKGTSVEWLDV